MTIHEIVGGTLFSQVRVSISLSLIFLGEDTETNKFFSSRESSVVFLHPAREGGREGGKKRRKIFSSKK